MKNKYIYIIIKTIDYYILLTFFTGEMRQNELNSLYFNFIYEHSGLIIQNLILEISLPILEISFYRILTKEIISKLKISTLIRTIQGMKKYLFYLVALQLLQFYNKYLVNRLLPYFQIYIRKNLMQSLSMSDYKRIEDNYSQNFNEYNTKLTINLNQLPLATYYAYDSILKYVVPLIALLSYITFSIFKMSVKYSLISLFYLFFNIIVLYFFLFEFSKQYQLLYKSHSRLVAEYNFCFKRKYTKFLNDKEKGFIFNKDDASCLKEKEIVWEKQRFALNYKINSFIVIMIILFYIFSAFLIYVFMKNYPTFLENLITLLIFSSRYYITILYRTYITVNSFGKLFDFQDTMLN